MLYSVLQMTECRVVVVVVLYRVSAADAPAIFSKK
jgi:hypothetical protein